MNETMSVTEALVYMIKEYKKMCDNTKLDKKDEMSASTALPCLGKISEATRKNEITWTDYSDYDSGEERFVTQCGNLMAVLLYKVRGCADVDTDVFKLYVETEEGKWYMFGDKFENNIINIYNWMTIDYPENKTNVVDAYFEEVDDKKPFEFVVNSNYNFEELGA